MNRALSTGLFLLLATAMAPLFVGCDSGPSCVANEVPATCTPECDAAAGEFCNDGTCQTVMTCDPACDATTQFCNPINGACENLPRACDPTCAGGEFCNDGTCEVIPVCDPSCGVNEHCE